MGFEVPVRGSDRRLAAKERAAAKDKSADRRRVNAEMAAALGGGGAERALQAAADFNCKDGEPAAARPAQLRVGALFGSSCSEQRGGSGATPCPVRACGGERGHQRSVDSKLGPSSKRQAVGNGLNAPVVSADRVDIEVPH